MAGADPPRLLHRDSRRGYTSNPLKAARGEPEAVPADIQETITSRAPHRPRSAA